MWICNFNKEQLIWEICTTQLPRTASATRGPWSWAVVLWTVTVFANHFQTMFTFSKCVCMTIPYEPVYALLTKSHTVDHHRYAVFLSQKWNILALYLMLAMLKNVFIVFIVFKLSFGMRIYTHRLTGIILLFQHKER